MTQSERSVLLARVLEDHPELAPLAHRSRRNGAD
jgi:hypothetical protein